MPVLIDGRPLQTASAWRGIGRYVGHVLGRFQGDGRCRFLFFRGAGAPALANAVPASSPRRLITLSDSLFLPPLFRRHGVSCYHSTAYALPRRVPGCRYLLTVYDLTLLKHPRLSRARHRAVFRRILASARRADLVLPISRSTAADLLDFARLDPGRLRIVPPMLDEHIAPEQAAKPAFAVPGEFLLYAGGGDPTKNLETLFKAVPLLGVPLLVAGPIGHRRAVSLLERVPARERRLVTFVGHVPDAELAWLYCRAAAFVFPSLNEGFGFPPLEALRCGAPAVVSRAGALPETLGDAALYVDDPLDAGQWRERIASVLSDSGLRRALLERAAALLPRYSPAAFRRSLESAYFADEA